MGNKFNIRLQPKLQEKTNNGIFFHYLVTLAFCD